MGMYNTGRNQELPVHVVFGKRLNEKHRWLVRFQMGMVDADMILKPVRCLIWEPCFRKWRIMMAFEEWLTSYPVMGIF